MVYTLSLTSSSPVTEARLKPGRTSVGTMFPASSGSMNTRPFFRFNGSLITSPRLNVIKGFSLNGMNNYNVTRLETFLRATNEKWYQLRRSRSPDPFCAAPLSVAACNTPGWPSALASSPVSVYLPEWNWGTCRWGSAPLSWLTVETARERPNTENRALQEQMCMLQMRMLHLEMRCR